jgi:hypothetical protein
MSIIYIFRQEKYIYSGDTLGGISLFLLFFRRDNMNKIMEKENISVEEEIGVVHDLDFWEAKLRELEERVLYDEKRINELFVRLYLMREDKNESR